MYINKIYFLTMVLCFAGLKYAYPQCVADVNAFPYNEGFENSAGNWVAGGYQSDWAWGTPAKPVIKNAGGGSKCWITGGLTASFYNYGEASFLQSPVFNISSLQNPYISFKIFWETEKRYDGASLQYSTNCGNTWVTLGNTADVINCPAGNWYNTSSSYLNGGQGWSGSKNNGTGGSGLWVTAFHSLNNAKGATSVIFRFTFNSGTQQNNYDGVAVDDIYIGEAPLDNVDFSYACATGSALSFSGIAPGNCNSAYLWNFGDPASGAANISNNQNATHVFSSAGTYNVTFTANSSSVTKTITVLNVAATNANVTCNGLSNGTATAIASGGDNYSYSWNTNPVQTTATINNLPAGTFTVTVNAANACPALAQVIITEPNVLSTAITTLKPVCKNNQGSIAVAASGGAPPYNYLWNTNPAQTTPVISNLSAGQYFLHLTDNNNCYKDFTVDVADSITPIHLFLGNDTAICPGQQLILQPGNFASYAWQDGSTASTYPVITTGDYMVKVSDINGCTAVSSIRVTVDCSNIYFPSAFTPNGDGLNDMFGPWGSLSLVSKYSFTVFDRRGQIVFQSTNPYEKWNGKFNGISFNTGTFVWVAAYSYNGSAIQTKKGTVIILH